MDKLEKALQKARALREAELKNLAAEQDRIRVMGQRVVTPEVTSHRVDISEDHLDNNRILAHRMRSKEADIFRLLRTQVLQIMGQSGFRTLGITSANYGDGKTTVSLNLAVSIALDLKQTVLLVDLDLRKPNVTRYLGVEAELGISDYFTNDVPIAQCMLRPTFERLTILPAGKPLDYSSEVLGSPKIAALAKELRERYPDRIIIYDMPPTLAQDDSIAFLPQVDGVLLVVRDGVTTANELKQSMNVLSNANVIGTVLNSPHSKQITGTLLDEAMVQAREQQLAGESPMDHPLVSDIMERSKHLLSSLRKRKP